jgi:hypothetical protein
MIGMDSNRFVLPGKNIGGFVSGDLHFLPGAP